MEIGPVTRIPVTLDPPDGHRSDTGPPAAAPVRTELPPRQAVSQAGRSGEAGLGDKTGPDVAQPLVERRLTIDPDTRQVVSAAYDQRTGDLLSQVPDQALLRLKIYAREVLAQQARSGQGDSRLIETLA